MTGQDQDQEDQVYNTRQHFLISTATTATSTHNNIKVQRTINLYFIQNT